MIFSAPKHLWSNESKFKKSWIVFNSEENDLENKNSPQSSGSSVDTTHSKEVDEYFKDNHFQSHSIISMKSCFCDSSQSIFSEKFKNSLMINQMECETCKNLIFGQEYRRSSLCGDCVERIYSPKTCATCNGRISFNDLKSSSSQQQVNKKHFDIEPELRLCNCFSKFPSQDMIDPNEIQVLPQIVGKSCSFSGTEQQKKKVESFYSQNCSSSKNEGNDDFLEEDK